MPLETLQPELGYLNYDKYPKDSGSWQETGYGAGWDSHPGV